MKCEYKTRNSGAALLMLIGLCAFCLMIGYGDPSPDEQYQTFSLLDWQETRVSPLSYWIGFEWLRLTGESIVNLRILSTLIGFMAVAASSGYCLWRSRSLLFSAFMFAVGAWCWRTDAFMLYNWDSGSLLWDSLALICIVEYARKPSVAKAFCCGAACALMALGRLPSGIGLPLFLLLMLWMGRRKSWPYGYLMKSAAACACAFLFIFCLVIILLYGGLSEYCSFENRVVSGHSLSDLSNYKHRFLVMLEPYIRADFGSALAMLAPLLFHRSLQRLLSGKLRGASKRNAIIGTASIVVGVVGLAVWNTLLWEEPNAECMLGGNMVVVAGLLLFLPLRNFSEPSARPLSIPVGQLVGCAIVVVAMIFGSDAFLERVEGGIMIPVLMVILRGNVTSGIKFYLKVSMVLLLLVSICICFTHYRTLSKVCAYRYPAELGLYAGLHGADDLDSEYRSLRPAIHLLEKEDNTRYLLIGRRHLWALVFGPDNGPHLNDFHFSSTHAGSENESKWAFLDNIDAALYTVESFDNNLDVQHTSSWLRAKGFIESERTPDYVILRSRAAGRSDNKKSSVPQKSMQ